VLRVGLLNLFLVRDGNDLSSLDDCCSDWEPPLVDSIVQLSDLRTKGIVFWPFASCLLPLAVPLR